MLRRIAIVLAACSGGGQKPVENVVKAPAYSCDTAVDAVLSSHKLGSEKPRVRTDLVKSCGDGHWPETFVACTSSGRGDCTDDRSKRDQAHALFIIECGDYIAGIEALIACPKLPRASTDAMRQGLDAMRSGWNMTDLPADAKLQAEDAAGNACKQGADAIDQAAKAAGC